MIHHKVHREGQGCQAPALLLNGLMMTEAAWTAFTKELVFSGRLLGCDFRGQLRSPGEPRAAFSENARDVIELLDHLGIERVHLIGTSFGAAVATMAAARYPGRVLSLTALTAGDHPDRRLLETEKQWRDACLAALNGGDPRDFVRRLFDAVYSDSFVTANRDVLEARLDAVVTFPRSWYEGLLGLMASVCDYDLRPELGKISCPTLVVAAALDRIIPAARSEALAAGIPGAHFEMIEDCGHGAVFEKPSEIGALVSRFLKGIGDEGDSDG